MRNGSRDGKSQRRTLSAPTRRRKRHGGAEGLLLDGGSERKERFGLKYTKHNVEFIYFQKNATRLLNGVW